jgi:hypothetical protein
MLPKKGINRAQLPGVSPDIDAITDQLAVKAGSFLPNKTLPDGVAERQLVAAVEKELELQLCKVSHLQYLWAKADVSQEELSFARVELSKWKHENPLPVPPYVYTEEINGVKLAIVVVLGTLLGTLFLAGLFKLMLDNPQTGQILGSLAGAGGSVIAMWYVSESKAIRQYLTAALGIATAAEVAIMFGKLSSIGALWGMVRPRFMGRGILTGLRRLLAYAGIVFVLRMSIRQPVFDSATYEKIFRYTLKLWVKNAVMFLQSLKHVAEAPHLTGELETKLLKKFGNYLYKLHYSSPEDLAIVASEQLLAARLLGFEGLDGDPQFLNRPTVDTVPLIWSSELEKTYDTVGIIEVGDAVFVEKAPVIHDGKVVEKGLVRKVRRKH